MQYAVRGMAVWRRNTAWATCQLASSTFSVASKVRKGQICIRRQLTGWHYIQACSSRTGVIWWYFSNRKSMSKTELLIMADNLTENDKWVWYYKMNDYLRTKRVLKGTLCTVCTLFMILMDWGKEPSEALPEFKHIEKRLDSMKTIKNSNTRAEATIDMQNTIGQWRTSALWAYSKKNTKISKTSETSTWLYGRYALSWD